MGRSTTGRRPAARSALVTINQLGVTPNTSGGFSRISGTAETRYAELRELSGRELANAQQMASEATHEFIFRDVGLKGFNNVDWNSRSFQVLRILYDERRLDARVLVREVIK